MNDAKAFIINILKGSDAKEVELPATTSTKIFQFVRELTQKALNMPYYEV